MKLLFFDIGGGELLILLVAAFLAFGPKQLVTIARKAGKTMSDLKKATETIKQEIMNEESDKTSSSMYYKHEIQPTPQSVDADYELAEMKKQQDKEIEKKENEQTTTA